MALTREVVGALSHAELVELVLQLDARLEQALAPIVEQRVDADETGLREDGTNGYLWSFSTERERYFVRGGRNEEIVDEVLGPDFAGVLVSDFYAAERSVRPVVCQRKISGGTRSPESTRPFTTLATLFGTWRARGLDPLVACRDLLLAQAVASV